MYLFYLLILLLPMLALRRRTASDAPILDSRSTTCLKGILCIYVMLHNLGLDLENSVIKEIICEHTGGIGVGLFFFLSAYGIVRSYLAKGNKYLPRLLLVHIPKMWSIAVFINALTYLCFFRGAYEGADLWLRILNLDFFNNLHRINRHGWYVASICALYVIFALVYFLCSRLKSTRKFIIAGIIMAIVPIAAMTTTAILDEGGMYTREIIGFSLGTLYATFYDKVNSLADRYFTPCMILSCLCLGVGMLVAEPMATCASAVIIVLVSQRYTYFSPVTYHLGKICLGVYLFLHFSSILMQPFIYNEYLWVLTNAGFIIECAIIIHASQYAIDYALKRVRGLILKTK